MHENVQTYIDYKQINMHAYHYTFFGLTYPNTDNFKVCLVIVCLYFPIFMKDTGTYQRAQAWP